MVEWSNWTELIEDYRQELTDLNKRKRKYSVPLDVLKLKKKNKEVLSDSEWIRMSELQQEVSLITNMITSTTYALNWLMNGKCPDNVTSIENYSYDQRTIEMDPKLLEVIYSTDDGLYNDVPEADAETIFKLESALSTLTAREKEIYILREGQQHSISDISEYLKVKPSTINTTLRRARHKIKLNKESDIFLLDGVL